MSVEQKTHFTSDGLRKADWAEARSLQYPQITGSKQKLFAFIIISNFTLMAGCQSTDGPREKGRKEPLLDYGHSTRDTMQP